MVIISCAGSECRGSDLDLYLKKIVKTDSEISILRAYDADGLKSPESWSEQFKLSLGLDMPFKDLFKYELKIGNNSCVIFIFGKKEYAKKISNGVSFHESHGVLRSKILTYYRCIYTKKGMVIMLSDFKPFTKKQLHLYNLLKTNLSEP